LVVSLSRIMKEPSTLPGARRWRSASFRLMPLKNHLMGEMEDMGEPGGAGPVRLTQGTYGHVGSRGESGNPGPGFLQHHFVLSLRGKIAIPLMLKQLYTTS
jgi:hypothetical protein